MKIKEGFVVRKALDEYIVVSTGSLVFDFNGIICLNETGAFLFQILQESDKTEEQLIVSLLSEFEIDEATAREDVREFVDILHEKDFLCIKG